MDQKADRIVPPWTRRIARSHNPHGGLAREATAPDFLRRPRRPTSLGTMSLTAPRSMSALVSSQLNRVARLLSEVVHSPNEDRVRSDHVRGDAGVLEFSRERQREIVMGSQGGIVIRLHRNWLLRQSDLLFNPPNVRRNRRNETTAATQPWLSSSRTPKFCLLDRSSVLPCPPSIL